MTSVLQRVLAVICLACLANPARAAERTSAIRDDAGLFRADVVNQAVKQIDDIRQTYHRNLFVDTVKSASPHKWIWFLRTREINRILQEQAQKHADESGQDGIYVVICHHPKDVHVAVRPDNDPAFTPRDAESLRRTIARLPRDKGPNDVLLAVVRQVESILQAHATRGQSTSVVNEFVLAGLLSGGVGLWLVLCLIRFKLRAGSSAAENTEEKAWRRPALLGAMFGFPAGQWIYDKLYPAPVRSAGSLHDLEPPALAEGDGAERVPVEEPAEDAPVTPDGRGTMI